MPGWVETELVRLRHSGGWGQGNIRATATAQVAQSGCSEGAINSEETQERAALGDQATKVGGQRVGLQDEPCEGTGDVCSSQ